MPGDSLMKEGDPSDAVYLLKSGTLNVFVNRNKVGEVTEGEFVGEMAFINGTNRTATVIAATECEIIEISKEGFHKALEGIPLWLKMFIQTLIKRINKANQS